MKQKINFLKLFSFLAAFTMLTPVSSYAQSSRKPAQVSIDELKGVQSASDDVEDIDFKDNGSGSSSRRGGETPSVPRFEEVSDPSLQTRQAQYLNLILGVEQDIQLPKLPPNVEFKGSFKKNVEALFSKERGVIRFRPKEAGFSVLTIHDKRNGKIVSEYRIDVRKSNLDKVVKEMKTMLSDIEGIHFKILNNKVVIDGQILIPKDMRRIYGVVSQFEGQATSIVTLSPIAQKKIAEFISRDINNPEITVHAVNDKILLKGFASSEEERSKAEIIAKIYLPDIIVDQAVEKGVLKERKPLNDGVINLIELKEAGEPTPGKMIQLVMHFVELKKDYSKAFRFQFTPELSDQTNLTFQTGGNAGSAGFASSITGVISNLLPKLNWAKEHGHARVLESTSIIVENGKKGTIKQTTSVPYKVLGKEGETGTAFAEVGLNTAIVPKIIGERSGTVAMDMEFAMSNLLGSANDGAPITSNNNVNTAVTIRDRQSAAIGGLIRNTTSTNYNRLPASVKNPIISLYASKSFQREQTQFVVFVTPVIKVSASAGSEQIKKKFRLRD
ncbi:MAG: BON domain-containing protein [Pseudobdellovibrionaceae bacterium]